jgi:hypothetical protein
LPAAWEICGLPHAYPHAHNIFICSSSKPSSQEEEDKIEEVVFDNITKRAGGATNRFHWICDVEDSSVHPVVRTDEFMKFYPMIIKKKDDGTYEYYRFYFVQEKNDYFFPSFKLEIADSTWEISLRDNKEKFFPMDFTELNEAIEAKLFYKEEDPGKTYPPDPARIMNVRFRSTATVENPYALFYNGVAAPDTITEEEGKNMQFTILEKQADGTYGPANLNNIQRILWNKEERPDFGYGEKSDRIYHVPRYSSETPR